MGRGILSLLCKFTVTRQYHYEYHSLVCLNRIPHIIFDKQHTTHTHKIANQQILNACQSSGSHSTDVCIVMNDIHTNNAYMQQIQMYTLYQSKKNLRYWSTKQE